MSDTAAIGVVPEWTAADRLVKARSFAGLTQVELAQRLGISEKTVKRYEASGQGRRGTLIGWAFTCGVSVPWLLGERGDGGDGGASMPTELPTGRWAHIRTRLPVTRIHLTAAA